MVRRYWRGPTWINSAWLIWLGLRRLGYESRGRSRWPTALCEAYVREGSREFYEPFTGEGLGRARVRLVDADRRAGGPGPRGAAARTCERLGGTEHE